MSWFNDENKFLQFLAKLYIQLYKIRYVRVSNKIFNHTKEKGKIVLKVTPQRPDPVV